MPLFARFLQDLGDVGVDDIDGEEAAHQTALASPWQVDVAVLALFEERAVAACELHHRIVVPVEDERESVGHC
ncbi:MAG: hypothetical protein R2849_18735 [Thermomicrobiales bacterium]